MLVKRSRLQRLAGPVATALLLVAVMPAPVSAGSLYYSHDSQGRLSQVCNAHPGDGERTDYGLDPRDNRNGYSNTKTDVALPPGAGISSPDGRFTLWMQADGNLVLYQNSNQQGLWGTGTNGTGANIAYSRATATSWSTGRAVVSGAAVPTTIIAQLSQCRTMVTSLSVRSMVR